MKKFTLSFIAYIMLLLITFNSCGVSELTQLQLENEELIRSIHTIANSIDYPKNEIIEIDGYKSVIIGKTIWMTENLNTSVYSNGDEIPEVKEQKKWRNLKTGAWCNYENDPQYGQRYGKLYNWYAVNDKRGLCPIDWRVASNGDWAAMIEHYGGKYLSANALKSDIGWGAENGKNFSGFSALPGGFRPTPEGSQVSKDFDGLTGGVWWTSTPDKLFLNKVNRNIAWGYDVCSDRLYRANDGYFVGKSVRCVKDYSENKNLTLFGCDAEKVF